MLERGSYPPSSSCHSEKMLKFSRLLTITREGGMGGPDYRIQLFREARILSGIYLGGWDLELER